MAPVLFMILTHVSKNFKLSIRMSPRDGSHFQKCFNRSVKKYKKMGVQFSWSTVPKGQCHKKRAALCLTIYEYFFETLLPTCWKWFWARASSWTPGGWRGWVTQRPGRPGTGRGGGWPPPGRWGHSAACPQQCHGISSRTHLHGGLIVFCWPHSWTSLLPIN